MTILLSLLGVPEFCRDLSFFFVFIVFIDVVIIHLTEHPKAQRPKVNIAQHPKLYNLPREGHDLV